MLFVPIRCERYLPERLPELTDAVIGGYPEFFRQVLPTATDRIGVVVVPVETLGTVVYAGQRRNADPRRYTPVFRKTAPDVRREPRNVEQPLLYALRFVLRQYHDLRRERERLVRERGRAWRLSLWLLGRSRLFFLVDRLGADAELAGLARRLVDRQQQGNPGVVHCGRDLLDLPEG